MPLMSSVAAVLMQVQRDDPVPVQRAWPGVPRDLAVICQKAMAREPLDRYSSAEDLAEDFTRIRVADDGAWRHGEDRVRDVVRRSVRSGAAPADVVSAIREDCERHARDLPLRDHPSCDDPLRTDRERCATRHCAAPQNGRDRTTGGESSE